MEELGIGYCRGPEWQWKNCKKLPSRWQMKWGCVEKINISSDWYIFSESMPAIYNFHGVKTLIVTQNISSDALNF